MIIVRTFNCTKLSLRLGENYYELERPLTFYLLSPTLFPLHLDLVPKAQPGMLQGLRSYMEESPHVAQLIPVGSPWLAENMLSHTFILMLNTCGIPQNSDKPRSLQE